MNWLAQQFEVSRGDAGHNLRPMEGLRGFAVFLVFLVHYVSLSREWIAPPIGISTVVEALHTVGNTGVDLFFVLSGYLIYGSLISRRQAFLGYMIRRVQRIYPVFLVVFILYLGLSFAFPAESKIPAPLDRGVLYIIANLLLLPGLFPIEPMITVAWSLSYEMFYYLFMPLAIVVFDLRRRKPRWRIAFFGIVCAAAFFYCSMFGGHLRLIMFVCGILLHETIQLDRSSVPSSSIALLMLMVGLSATLLPIAGAAANALKVGIVFVSFFALCHSCFARPTDWLARAFSWTALRWLGNMSYSYYLIHGLTLKAAFMVLGSMGASTGSGALFFFVVLPPMFVVTLLPSAALFITVERPMSIGPQVGRNGLSGHAVASK